MTPVQVAERRWRPGRPVDLVATLQPLRRSSHDPTLVLDRWAGVWRTGRTPLGPATQHLSVDPADSAVCCTAWGPGAEWMVETLPELLGERDTSAVEFVPRHPVVREAWRRHPGWRVPRTALVWPVLVGSVLEQKVTGGEAWRAWRQLVRRYGDVAPGPSGVVPVGLYVVPGADAWRRIPSWEWHRAGVGPDRARTIVGAAVRAAALERTLDRPPAEVEAALRALPGVGAWTAAEVRQRAHGDPDAVSVGDLHLPGQVVYALTGAMDGDDDQMLELLEPYAGHRYRVVRMIDALRRHPPAPRPPLRPPGPPAPLGRTVAS